MQYDDFIDVCIESGDALLDMQIWQSTQIAHLRADIDRSEVVIEALRAQVALHRQRYINDIAEWERVGNAIMLCATGKEAPLSDSDVCGVIEDLRAQVAETVSILGGREDSNLVQLARTVAELCAE